MKGKKMSTGTRKKGFIILISFAACIMGGIGIRRADAQEDTVEEAETLSSFESRINAIIEENTILKKRLRELVAQPTETDKHSGELQGVIGKLQEESRLLSVQLEEKAREQEETKKKIEELKSQVAALKNELTQNSGAKDALRKIQEENSAFSRQLSEKDKENESFKDHIGQLSQKLKANEVEMAMLEAMLHGQALSLRPVTSAQADGDNFDKIIHENLGFAYGMKGNIDEAIREYQKVIEYASEDKDAHYNLGYLLSKKKAYAQAVEEYKKALKGLPQDKEVYYNLAIIYTVGLKDLSTAQEFHQKFLSLSSSGVPASPEAEEAPLGTLNDARR